MFVFIVVFFCLSAFKDLRPLPGCNTHQAVALASLAQAVLTVLPLPDIRFSRVRPIVRPKPFSANLRNQIAMAYFSSGLYLYQSFNEPFCSFEHCKYTAIIADSQHFSYVFYHFWLNVVSTRERALKTAELCYNKLKRTNNHSFLFGILVYFFDRPGGASPFLIFGSRPLIPS